MIDLSRVNYKDSGTVVYHAIRKKILSLEYQPGAQLSEQKLSDEYGISRTPVREAFIKLVGEDLLEARPYRGTIVTKIDLRQVEEVRFIRNCLEGEVAQLACGQDMQPYLTLARRNITQQRKALKNKDMQGFIDLDDEMHRQLLLACGKQLSWQVIEMVSGHYQRLRHAVLDTAGLPQEHEAILNAIEAKDKGAARRAVDKHLGHITDEIADVQAAYPDYFTN